MLIINSERRSKKGFAARFFACILIVTVIVSGFSCVSVHAAPSVSASSAVLIDAKTGEILYAKNENEKRSMASTTKIMTSLLALESDMLEEELTVTDEMVRVEGTSMGLMPDDKVTLETLVYGMLLQSGNDAANAVALTLAGSQEEFAAMMNERARQIGVKNTNFVTPSGLDDEQHYSTAYDMAMIAREAMSNENFAHIASQKTAKVSFGNPPVQRMLSNHNRLLSMYEGTIGVKTGFTKKSGRCLVSCAERDGVRLIAVTLRAPSDWNDHMAMYDYGFSLYKERELDLSEIAQTIPVTGSYTGVGALCRTQADSVRLTDEQAKRVNIKADIPKFIYAPAQSGQLVGYADIMLDDIVLQRLYLTLADDISAYKIPESEKSFWQRLIEWITDGV